MKPRDVLTNTAAFLFLGLPGLALMLAGFVGLVSAVVSGGRDLPRVLARLDSPVVNVAWYAVLFLVGSLMALLGVRREHEPLYLLVLWSIPIGALLGMLGPESTKESPGWGAGVAAVIALAVVRWHYGRRKPLGNGGATTRARDAG